MIAQQNCHEFLRRGKKKKKQMQTWGNRGKNTGRWNLPFENKILCQPTGVSDKYGYGNASSGESLPVNEQICNKYVTAKKKSFNTAHAPGLQKKEELAAVPTGAGQWSTGGQQQASR